MVDRLRVLLLVLVVGLAMLVPTTLVHASITGVSVNGCKVKVSVVIPPPGGTFGVEISIGGSVVAQTTVQGQVGQSRQATLTLTPPFSGANMTVRLLFAQTSLDSTSVSAPSDNCEQSGSGGGGDDDDSDAGPPFEPGDDRINRDPGATVRIYCREGNLEVVFMDPVSGTDGLTLRLTAEQIQELANDTSVGGKALLLLAGVDVKPGEIRIVGGIQPDGKRYMFIIDGCPPTRGQAYNILPDGQWELIGGAGFGQDNPSLGDDAPPPDIGEGDDPL